jgi:hypothetical protein
MFLLAVALWMRVQTSQQVDLFARQVQVQVATIPETVTVGQHFVFTVRVHVPAGLATSIIFPTGPYIHQDTITGGVSPVQRHDSPRGGFVNSTATYVLSAWYPGRINIGFGSLAIGHTHIRIPDLSIVVRSVLPKNPAALAKVIPKEPRALIVDSVIKRIYKHLLDAWIFFVVLLLAAITAFFLWRSRCRESLATSEGDWAEREFRRIEAMQLLEKGAPEQYAILMSMVVRQFLIRTFATVREPATTRELVTVLRGEPLIPAEQVLSLFERADLLKFANMDIHGSEAQRAGIESRTIVSEVLERHRAAVIALQAEQAHANGKKTAARRKQAA